MNVQVLKYNKTNQKGRKLFYRKYTSLLGHLIYSKSSTNELTGMQYNDDDNWTEFKTERNIAELLFIIIIITTKIAAAFQ